MIEDNRLTKVGHLFVQSARHDSLDNFFKQIVKPQNN